MNTLSFLLDNQHLVIQIKRQAYRRNLKLQYKDQRFTVTAPKWIPLNQIETFLVAQKDWINKRLKNQQSERVLPELAYDENTKRAAKILVLSLIEQYSSLYPYPFQKVTIKNLQTKWGSCSRKKNLNFNYRIIALPEHLAAYLVVHELCHLHEFNHSLQFWKLVAKAFPHYRELRQELHSINFKSIS